MAEIGALLPQTDASTSRHHGRRSGDEGFARRFRKTIVIATLAFGDLVAATAAIACSRALIGMSGTQSPDPGYLMMPLVVVVFLCVGLYSGCGPSPYERFRLRAIGVAALAAIDLLVESRLNGLSALPVAVATCDAFCLLILSHYAETMVRAMLIRLGLWGASAAVVGCGDSSQTLARFLERHPSLGLRPIGFIETSRDQAARGALPLPLIGELAEAGRPYPDVEFALFVSASELCAASTGPYAWLPTCRFLLVEDVQDLQSLWLRTRTLGRGIGIEIRRDVCLPYNQALKRAIDLFVAVPLAVLAAPIILLLAAAIKIIDPGPAIYVQDRVGRNAKTLRIFKLRTMYAGAEQRLQEHLCNDPVARAEWQRFFKLSHDPRVLPIVGNLLRRTSLDELPQLWNVIRGEMSLVGPRPFPAYHMNGFDPEFRVIRTSVQPGITGMWQISSRSDGDLEVQRAQDLFYIRNWSIWLDLYILLQTVIVVIEGKGAR
ncbi:exopolysaccharide biosynthesis polyprenyl glycosylphosphotransferase [Bradyrhizobium sp. WSM 1704]|uniref:exopolysaccharide biosynthesis polyprenyl glycosylphosphotransferase n=1 Tax=Bradyrhizobium semiaridum TaxID=2821404 RepID=UPI001CE275A0|nr:exopolysaccharide biosynthesis polyprenyl glycosylphosphotransferase [Bradyrhizobium semiaridum]MCA6122016.1 exopolysaccharide biosynthesis polyprenyl glycosylphosphotransferase [Bradyrhizobium semiaridum]